MKKTLKLVATLFALLAITFSLVGCKDTPETTPSVAPSVAPTLIPSVAPSVAPTVVPTATPSTQPSLAPTVVPTENPTIQPTVSATPAKSGGCRKATAQTLAFLASVMALASVMLFGKKR